MSKYLGYDISSALLGLHTFTECGSVSSFKGKCKVKALKDSKDYICAFKELGTS